MLNILFIANISLKNYNFSNFKVNHKVFFETNKYPSKICKYISNNKVDYCIFIHIDHGIKKIKKFIFLKNKFNKIYIFTKQNFVENTNKLIYNNFELNKSINNKLNILYMFLSCKRDIKYWDIIKKKYKNRNFIILCGDESLKYDYKLENKILYLKCNDNYEALAEKMIRAFLAFNSIKQFENITHIIKLDSNKINYDLFSNYCLFNNSFNINNIINKKKNYISPIICTGTNNKFRKYHINRCSENSYWNKKEYSGPVTNYGSGAFGYILSKKSINLICSLFKDENEINKIYKNHIYEDLMIGLLLKKFNIIVEEIEDKYIEYII